MERKEENKVPVNAQGETHTINTNSPTYGFRPVDICAIPEVVKTELYNPQPAQVLAIWLQG